MRVFRVEHPETGLGPYGGKHAIPNMGYKHADDAHPAPYEDGISIQMHQSWEDPEHWEDIDHCYRRCGMDSLVGLMQWFEGWWDRLREHGHVIVQYEVPDKYVSVGRSGQVVFAYNMATRVG